MHKNHLKRVPLLGFIAILCLSAAYVLRAGIYPPGQTASKAAKNVIVILIDDLSDDVGFLGSGEAHTPSLDALASRSVVFEQAFAQAPLCNPSRTSFLTGTYPNTTGIYGLKPDFWEVPALASLHTLPGYFRQAGYYTGTVGKVFHQRAHEASYDYVKKGWFGAFGPFPPEPLQPDFNFNPYFDWGPYLQEKETADYKVASAALKFLQKAKDKQSPFFLTLGFFRPHSPRYAPQEFFDLHPIDRVSIPPITTGIEDEVSEYALTLVNYQRRQRYRTYLSENGRERENIQAYRASISLVDRQVGRLMEYLSSSGLDTNTVIVLASDHGVQNGEKNLWYKRTLWEGSTRVPLLIAIPETKSARVASAVGLIDIFPTLVEYASLPLPAQLEGRSLMPYLLGSTSATAGNGEPVLTVHGPGNFALRNQRWRYIQYADGSEELYDHSNDSSESVNLAIPSRQTESIRSTLDYFREKVPREYADFVPGTSGFSSKAFPGK
ncbi:sulfatase [Parahaliea mediterranea]|uniref:Sulfatase n=1 Tax=Parahaliea mediterranea TaxID=651086 RepID=A0A939IL71_9GAMM|nr:sulfatase [Parahaliea mediterranea]MBN7795662.1 sulfatase [Parahaliea mediterranea]